MSRAAEQAQHVARIRVEPNNVQLTKTPGNSARPLQYPIARAVRAFRVAVTPEDQYLKLLAAADTITICLGITAATLFKSQGLGSQKLPGLQKSLCGIGATQGAWKKMVDAFAEHLTNDPGLLPSARLALEQRGTSPRMTSDLETLLQARNHHAHGGYPRDKYEAGQRATALKAPFERVVAEAQFLADLPWVLVESCSFRKQSRDFQITAQNVMGEHPEFDRQVFTSTAPLADEALYAIGPHGPIDLYPLVISRYCDNCRIITLFYADRVLKNGATQLKCFDRGHDIFDSEATADLRLLASPNL